MPVQITQTPQPTNQTAPQTNSVQPTPINSSGAENTSGQGKNSIVPEEVKGWSWGAFFWNWIWAWANRVWIAVVLGVAVLLMVGFSRLVSHRALVSDFGIGGFIAAQAISLLIFLVYGILLGFKGKEWSWKARKWDSIEQFNQVQKQWALFGE